jgi:hypothetical protein
MRRLPLLPTTFPSSEKTQFLLGNNPVLPLEQRRGHASTFRKTKVTWRMCLKTSGLR